ncbi:MAG TPA: hypothetical protein VHH73_13600 [Verrucomicrobiae bacterium]|nr:hypothetical protein [Verrucomicrobiae bacterium]
MARVYDLVMTHKLDSDDFFIHRVQEHCAAAGLNFFLVEPLWVEAFYERLAAREIHCKVLLNLHSEHHQPDEIYHRLVQLADQRGAVVIDPPGVALAAFDKARVHPQLIAAGLLVPYTVLVSAGDAAQIQLSPGQREMLGSPFVIKPALGYGKRGVILDATSERDLERSRVLWPVGDYLFQRRIVPREIEGEPGYFRVYYVFGAVWISWWNCRTDRYRLPTAAETTWPELARMEAMARQIASLTGMNFFSSEIAVTESNECVLIDYVNDQCHLLTQSADPRIGVPDPLVASIARRLVEAAGGIIRKPR